MKQVSNNVYFIRPPFKAFRASLGNPHATWGNYRVGDNSCVSLGESLQKMADIATEYLPQSTSKDVLKCQYALAMNEIDLAKYFTQVAESLREHQPMLMRK
ncbi:10483_t:CDS:1 [Ambispora gerdemannii]|uniref:10483_t:CDS:1 n=1 Tax=Ambispora gerdemannii TaxID=144530 RepID=A0A9N9FN75_9GLOM|nr:10483_t:CDS:1 [Ambispora gerdemannii]